MHKIDDNLAKVTARIQLAAQKANRDPMEILLLAVSKTQAAEAIERAYCWGQRQFGENYVQEAVEKKTALAHLPGIQWHFIGPIQSNKTRVIAENFAWVHSIDREKAARRLSDQRPATLPALQVCVQVNLDDEESKSGVTLAALPALARYVAALPNLRLRGLMTIPAPNADPQQQSLAFSRMRKALEQLQREGLAQMDTLSMGMSADLEAAISCGATIVRVGSDIFGAREGANASTAVTTTYLRKSL